MKFSRLLDTKEKRVGFYSTLIFHLVVIIVFLMYSINAVVAEDQVFMMDFSKQEQLEKEIRELEIKREASKEIEELLSGKKSESYRNVAVDRGASKHLKDDRFKNPNQVYDEAKALQKKLDASRREALKEQGTDDVASNNTETKKSEQTYKGPSVLSYKLDNRKGISLPVPAYKSFGGGDVTIRIVVNRKGYVVDASVVDALSTKNSEIRKYALQAAKKSRFSASSSAPDRQVGEIVYRFVAQ